MNIKKKTLSLLLALTFMFGALPPFNFLIEKVYAADSGGTVTVYAGDPISNSTINYDGRNIGAGAYIVVDGVQYPAYCVDPNLPGAEGHPNKQYPINITGTNMAPMVATVLHNSYPYVTREDIKARYPGMTDAQIYAATKAAIRAVAEQSAHRYPDDDLWDGDPQTVAFARYLINLARLVPGDVPQSAIYGTNYAQNPATVVVPVRWGQTAEAVFDNQPHTSIEVTKINSKTNQPVAGAVFTLTHLESGKTWTLTTLAGGRAVVSNIPAGQYTIQEIYVPEPLILNNKVVNIQINNDKVNSYTAANDEKPKVTVEKYDEKTGQLLPGAEFRLERIDGAWQTEFMNTTGTVS